MGADPGPLSGQTIVVTRSVSDNASLVNALTELGAAVISAPMVEVVPPLDGGKTLAAAVNRLAGYQWVVLTSVNGVDAMRDALAAQPWPDDVVVAPVGPATAAAAKASGMTVAAPPPEATAASLVAHFPDPPEPDGDNGRSRVLAPLAELAGPTVSDGLSAKGYQVDRIEAYRTVEPELDRADSTRLAIDLRDADAATFFSPSAIDRYVHRFGADSLPPIVVCIGPATAERAAVRGISQTIIAEPHSEHGVIDALVQALRPGGYRSP